MQKYNGITVLFSRQVITFKNEPNEKTEQKSMNEPELSLKQTDEGGSGSGGLSLSEVIKTIRGTQTCRCDTLVVVILRQKN